MSETRREIFRISLLSSLGLMSAAALAGCGPHILAGGNETGPDGNSPIVGFHDHEWYVFVWDSDKGKYRLSKTTAQYGSLHPDKVHFFTQEFLADALSITGSGQLQPVTDPLKAWGISFTFDENGCVNQTTEVREQTNSWTPVSRLISSGLSWNEIGKK